MGRVYSVAVAGVSLTASTTPDLWSVLPGSNKPLRLHEVEIAAEGVTAAAEIRFSVKRMTATVTQGSGGTTPTAAQANRPDTSTAATLHNNDSTNATTTGSTEVLRYMVLQVTNGYQVLYTPETRPDFAVGELLLVKAESVGATTSITTTLTFEEVV